MGLNEGPPKKSMEELYEVATANVAAETLLEAMGPQLKRAFNMRLKTLFDAPPELGALLDARAQLKVVWEFQTGLERDTRKGKAAVEIFNKLLLSNV